MIDLPYFNIFSAGGGVNGVDSPHKVYFRKLFSKSMSSGYQKNPTRSYHYSAFRPGGQDRPPSDFKDREKLYLDIIVDLTNRVKELEHQNKSLVEQLVSMNAENRVKEHDNHRKSAKVLGDAVGRNRAISNPL